MEREPRDEELRAFINAMLSNVDKGLREPDVIDEALRDQRDMWVMLYRASASLDTPS